MTAASDSLVIRGLHVTRGARPILRGVDLDVAPGEIVALMGASGAGKSTALRAIVALQPFERGSITIGDVALTPGPVPPESALRSLRRRVGMVFQAHALFEHLSVLDNLTIAPIHALGWSREKAESVARRLLESLGVASRIDALPRQLSGGEAQRVAIARALAPDPTMLLMDEPTSALDPSRRGALGETLRGLATDGRGLVVSTHDVDFARGHADRVVVLVDGSIVEMGSAEQVLSQPQHPATRELLRHPAESRRD
ncbi:MAG: ATP-binding cassette domain-containing protein [bacterium]